MKLTREDFRPRTRPGFYTRKGGDVIRVEYVEPYRQGDKPLGVLDWWVGLDGTLTESPKIGPSPGTPHTWSECTLAAFTSHGWRPVKPHKLKPAWQEFFGVTQLEVTWSEHGG